MPLRSLLNAVYAALADGRDTDQLEELDKQLDEEPRKRSQTESEKKQVAGLMAMMRKQPGGGGGVRR